MLVFVQIDILYISVSEHISERMKGRADMLTNSLYSLYREPHKTDKTNLFNKKTHTDIEIDKTDQKHADRAKKAYVLTNQATDS